MTAATAERIPVARLPRSYLVWLGGAVVSQLGDAALYFALGWAASAHGGPAAGLVLSAINLPRTALLLAGRGSPRRRRHAAACCASRRTGSGWRSGPRA
ncbi:MAG: hypothetical protein ABSA93_39420 [Streptosporangiaceae bacterium]|jgi:hypothetical protein